jgi:hypothetical protein
MRYQSLCEVCRHRREVISGKGSRFLLCMLAQQRPEIPKYPPQPVVRCRGFEPRAESAPKTAD